MGSARVAVVVIISVPIPISVSRIPPMAANISERMGSSHTVRDSVVEDISFRHSSGPAVDACGVRSHVMLGVWKGMAAATPGASAAMHPRPESEAQ